MVERAQVLHLQFGFLQRGKVSTTWHLHPSVDAQTAFRPLTWRQHRVFREESNTDIAPPRSATLASDTGAQPARSDREGTERTMQGGTTDHIRHIEEAILPEPTLRSQPQTRPLLERMAVLGVPGVSVAVLADGAVDWTRGWGLHEAGSTDSVTVTTLFRAASISKPVTAVAVMRLVQERLLALDEDVSVYLRSWRVPANGTVAVPLGPTCRITSSPSPGRCGSGRGER
jgi:CubicO group peptidase (beta-lactamase class C family)